MIFLTRQKFKFLENNNKLIKKKKLDLCKVQLPIFYFNDISFNKSKNILKLKKTMWRGGDECQNFKKKVKTWKIKRNY